MALYELDGQGPELPADGNCWVAESAAVMGKVRLKSGASVWFGAVLRGDNEWIELGEGSNIQDNAVCHTDPGQPITVGKNVTVGHSAILHGCTVEDNVVIGMGAIVLNGARVRRGCVVGAGAIVTENKDFPENSLILGAPAKVVRTMTAEEVAQRTRGPARYVQNSQRFKKGLKRID